MSESAVANAPEKPKPVYDFKKLARDWYLQAYSKQYSDEQVEARLLSKLPFFPNSDGKRVAKFINTDIGNGRYIHEFYIENIEPPRDPDSANVNSASGTLTTTGQAATNTKAELEPALDRPQQPYTRDVVLVHGYAASLGLFFENFDSLSAVPGIRIHAIDLLGFGFLSRPKFPKFPSATKDDIYKVEDWFIDSMEEWRKRRGIEKFVLVGHSFGGYLSCAYALKYQKDQSPLDRLVLLSPVGVERHRNSLLTNEVHPLGQVSETELRRENSASQPVDISAEVNADQQDIVHGRNSHSGNGNSTATPNKSENDNIDADNDDPASRERRNFKVLAEPSTEPPSRSARVARYLWAKNVSPFSLVRNIGPWRSKIISNWTMHRFSSYHNLDPQQYQYIHDYFYRVFNGGGSGEYAITRILGWGALAKCPLLDRCPPKFVQMNLPTMWLYGDKDWMNESAGEEMVQEINNLSDQKRGSKLATFGILKNAGHHLYLDNPTDTKSALAEFCGWT